MKIKTPLFYMKIDILFVIVMFIFFVSSKTRNYFNSFIICYSFIVFHEATHMLVGVLLGKEIDTLNIGVFGVNVSFKNLHYEKNLMSETKKEVIYNILIYLAGPFSNFVLAIVFNNIKLVFDINVFLGILNLIPVYPLDGYNVLYNVLKLLNCNVKLITIIINIFNNIVFILLFIIGIYLIVKLYNPSLMLFLIYLIVLKIINSNYKNKTKYYK